MRNSTHSKISEVIDALRDGPQPIDAFAESLREERNAFVYYRRDSDGSVKTEPCSLATIRRNIRFCIDLGLLENSDDCDLTSKGRSALDADRYDLVLQQAVIDFLDRNSLPWVQIESAINDLAYPSPSQLFARLSPPLSEELFRTCLLLLSQCGHDSDENILEGLTMKIYLTDEKARDYRR